MIGRTAIAVLALAAPQGLAAQTVFPAPDAEGCFAIAESFRFCGAGLGWRGNGSSHPDITAIFNSDAEGEWLVFKLFDPETGVMGAFDAEPSEAAAEMIDRKRQSNDLDAEIRSAKLNGGVVVRQTSGDLNDRTLRTAVIYFTREGATDVRVVSEFTGEPWLLTVSSSTTGSSGEAWTRHADALAALEIQK